MVKKGLPLQPQASHSTVPNFQIEIDRPVYLLKTFSGFRKTRTVPAKSAFGSVSGRTLTLLEMWRAEKKNDPDSVEAQRRGAYAASTSGTKAGQDCRSTRCDGTKCL